MTTKIIVFIYKVTTKANKIPTKDNGKLLKKANKRTIKTTKNEPRNKLVFIAASTKNKTTTRKAFSGSVVKKNTHEINLAGGE